MNHRERIEKTLSGDRPDRVPVALWRHFPVDDQDPERLAAAVLAFQRLYDFDLVKVTFASSYFVKDWGGDDEWRGVSEGTRSYTQRPIETPEDWERLPILDPRKGQLADQLACLRSLRDELGTDVPLLPTIFNPLTQARKMVGDEEIAIHIRRYPEALHRGLKVIMESTIRFLEAMGPIGVDGIFYAIQHAQYRLYSENESLVFGKEYDLQVLESTKDMWLNMLHVHGTDIMYDQVVDYPVQVINWHDRETSPSLAEGKERFPGVVCGGLRRIDTMELGTPSDVEAEARQAIEATGGLRFILGTGCVIPITTPHGNIVAARQVVET